MTSFDHGFKEDSEGLLLEGPESCASCGMAERFELKAESIIALCKKDDCTRFSKPISYKFIADLKPSEKITVEVLEFAKAKVADRIARERRRQMKRMKQDGQKELPTVAEVARITRSTIEDARSQHDEPQTEFIKLDEDFKQINDSFESRFEGIRKRLAKARELRTKENAGSESAERADSRGWDQLMEKYKRMLKAAEPELDSLQQKASGIDKILETKIRQVDEELPIKECELRVEVDLKEDTNNIEQLQKQVGSLRKQQEECLPRREKLKNLLDRMQYCATETCSAQDQPVPQDLKEEAKNRP